MGCETSLASRLGPLSPNPQHIMKDSMTAYTPSAVPVPRSSRNMLLLGATLMFGAFAADALAIDYYWHSADNTSTWNTTSKWFTSPGGGGAAHVGGMSSDNTYITNVSTNVLNTNFLNNTGATDTFLGGTLVLESGGQFNIRTNGTSSALVPNFLTTGGGVIAAASGTGVTNNLIVDSFNNQSGVTALRTSSGTNNRHLNLEIGTLTGSGGFTIDATAQTGRTLFLSATDATAYTGTFDFSHNTIINFDNDLVSGGSLLLSGSAKVMLDQDVSFASVTISGTSLSDGVYSFATLDSMFDLIFEAGGSGSITVGTLIPESSSFALLAGGAMLFGCVTRRRRA